MLEKKNRTNKQKALISIKKANTLLKRVVEMAEDNKYCINIMQQNLAVIGLLKSANQSLLEGHLKTCFKDAMLSKNKKKQENKIEEILKVTKLSNK